MEYLIYGICGVGLVFTIYCINKIFDIVYYVEEERRKNERDR